MCCLERPAVVAAVAAHDDLAAQLLQALDQLDLLLGQHPGHKGVTVIFTILREGDFTWRRFFRGALSS